MSLVQQLPKVELYLKIINILEQLITASIVEILQRMSLRFKTLQQIMAVQDRVVGLHTICRLQQTEEVTLLFQLI
ncbi:hypothetical protein D3C86_1791110 [compost metagenome]